MELFYIARDDRLTSVPIQFASNGNTANLGFPAPLFTTRVGGAVQSPDRPQYIVSRDGQRFLMNTITQEPVTSPITLVLNWRRNYDVWRDTIVLSGPSQSS